MDGFQQRIGYNGKIDDISIQLCKDYGLGKFISNNIIFTGYEDLNYILKTLNGQFFVKIFRQERTDADCKRIVDVYLEAIKKGVNHPNLFESNQGFMYSMEIGNTKLRLCAMQFVEGDNFYGMNEKPALDEIKIVAKQAALINSMGMKPVQIYDSWAIVNFLSEFDKKAEYLPKDDLELIEPLVMQFKQIEIESLPHCFVHGDITCTNLMRGKDDKLWIIDFSCSNWYPRIQELAVLGCDVCFHPDDKNKSEQSLKALLSEYQKTIRLSNDEMKKLPTYIRLAHGMHLLCAGYEKYKNGNNTKENEYFLNHGRTGLRQTSGTNEVLSLIIETKSDLEEALKTFPSSKPKKIKKESFLS
jgi:Ser/Thr protein kinase RdoA (MazF antagonist)